MTIEKTIEIPASRKITLEVPPEIPVGSIARLELIWSSEKEMTNNLDLALEKIWMICKDSSITVDSFLAMRRNDKELEETQYRKFFPENGDGT